MVTHMKITRRIALLLACLFVLGAFFSCGAQTPDPALTGTDTSTPFSSADTAQTEAPSVRMEIGAENLGEYIVIRSTDADAAIVKAAADLRTEIGNALGSQLRISEDWVKNPASLPASAKEIVVGRTNRPGNDELLGKLRPEEYLIAFKNDRIYILGGSDDATLRAIDYFKETYLDRAAKNIVLESTLFDLHRYDYPLEQVCIDGIDLRDYTIVIPADADLYTRYAAQNLSDYYAANAGFPLTVTTDKSAETEYEILIGATNRAVSSGVADAGEDQYICYKNGKKIVCLGKSYMVGGGVGALIARMPADGKNAVIDIKDIPTTPTAATFHFEKPKSAILMIGDGMGFHSIDTALATIGSFCGADLPNRGQSVTSSLNTLANAATPTDSAAGATALSTANRTYNGYVGLNASRKPLQNIRELARLCGARTGVITTDVITGATPAGFLAHHTSRSDTAVLQAQIDELIAKREVDWCQGSVGNDLTANTAAALRKLSAGHSSFFLMIEEGHIDKNAHKANMPGVISMVERFNDCIAYVTEFVVCHPDTVVIITADHETGGLTPATSIADVAAKIKAPYNTVYKSNITGDISKYGFAFTSYKAQSSSPCEHTTANVPVFALGSGTEVFDGQTVQNTDIPKFIAQIYGKTDFGQ